MNSIPGPNVMERFPLRYPNKLDATQLRVALRRSTFNDPNRTSFKSTCDVMHALHPAARSSDEKWLSRADTIGLKV